LSLKKVRVRFSGLKGHAPCRASFKTHKILTMASIYISEYNVL
jgi:hypothetical protein